MKLAEILRLKIQTINNGNGINCLDIDGSVGIKNITRTFISKVTKLMKVEVEEMIYTEFKQYFELLKEKCNYKQLIIDDSSSSACKCKEVEPEGLREQNIILSQTNKEAGSDFLDYVDFDIKYSIKELTELYNNFHKTTSSTISVGKLSYIRQHSEKKRETNPVTHKQEYMDKLEKFLCFFSSSFIRRC